MATTLYFAQLDPVWHDWIVVVNVGNAPTKITCIGRDINAQIIWNAQETLRPYQIWTPATDTPKVSVSCEIRSDGQPIIAERHCHSGTQVLDFAGASEENQTVGRRLFFPELVAGATDWFRFLNVGNAEAHISVIVRDILSARIVAQRSNVVKPLSWWELGDEIMGAAVQGTVEVVSSQPIVGERHLHYKGGQVAVGQLGQVIG